MSERVRELIELGQYDKATGETPDDPIVYEMYWKDKEYCYSWSFIRYNKHRIIRYMIDTKSLDKYQLISIASNGLYHYNLAFMHILDACGVWFSYEFCESRLLVRKVAIAVLSVGRRTKALRDVMLIIARIVWGMRGYCKIETETIKRIRLRG